MILGLKTLWTTKADWILLYQSIKQFICLSPRLIFRNAILIIILIALGSCIYRLTYGLEGKDNYIYKLIHLNEINVYIYKLCAELLFSSLEWSILIFLIPFQLYQYTNDTSEQPLSSLKNFIKKNIRPLFTESTKAFGVVTLYFLICFTLIALTVSIKGSALNDALKFSPTMGEFNISSLFGQLLLIFFLFPSIMKLIQYLLIPYVIVSCTLTGFFLFVFIGATIASMTTEGMEPFDIPAILGLCFCIFALSLFFIKTLQYTLVPYIVLFNKTFQLKENSTSVIPDITKSPLKAVIPVQTGIHETSNNLKSHALNIKDNPLKIASQLSRGIVIPLCIVFGLAVLILLFVNGLLYQFSSNVWILSIVSSTVRILIHIACISILYFMYKGKSTLHTHKFS